MQAQYRGLSQVPPLAVPQNGQAANLEAAMDDTRAQMVTTATDALGGSHCQEILSWIFFAASSVFTFIAFMLQDFTIFQRCFCFMSCVFLLCASFNLVETMGTRSMKSALDQIHMRQQTNKDEAYLSFLLKGVEFGLGHSHTQYVFYGSFVMALGCSTVGVFVMPNITGPDSGPAFSPDKLALLAAGISTLFSSLNLSCYLRDSAYADALYDLYEMCDLNLAGTVTIAALQLARNSLQLLRLAFAVSTLFSLLLFFFMIWLFNVNHAHLGFMIPGIAFMVVTSWYLAMSLEDSEHIHGGRGVVISAVAVFMVSAGLTGFGLARTVVDWKEKLALFAEIVFVIFSVFFLAMAHHKSQRTRHYFDQVALMGDPQLHGIEADAYKARGWKKPQLSPRGMDAHVESDSE